MKNSDLIIPVSLLLHLGIINGVLFFLTPETYKDTFHIIYYNGAWLLITYSLNFYPTGRQETFFTNIIKLVKLFLIFGLVYLASFGFNEQPPYFLRKQLFVLSVIFGCLLWYRYLFYLALRKYRMKGGNSVKVVIIGKDDNLRKIVDIFEDPYLGYIYCGFFDDKGFNRTDYQGKIENCFHYILENNIEEIYCTTSRLSKHELQNLKDFADNNLVKFKLIPDHKEIFTRAMYIERFGTLNILDLRKVPLDTDRARITKRLFDIGFSLLIIVFILSWLTPLMLILIKMESPGPLYFKQPRNGLRRKIFICYKYRSMTVNGNANTKMACKNDARVTKIGNFIRKTSIDELPQFYNVLRGEMSVVGPRPHMTSHTLDYQSSVDKYSVRHFVKPGITGLAQIKGYRGEIVHPIDIRSRIRLDIFYVEKWCLLLDLKIIAYTIINTFGKNEKAY